MFIVIQEGGFLTTKEKDNVLVSDIVVCEADKEECMNIIHGKGKNKDEKDYNDTNNTN